MATSWSKMQNYSSLLNLLYLKQNALPALFLPCSLILHILLCLEDSTQFSQLLQKDVSHNFSPHFTLFPELKEFYSLKHAVSEINYIHPFTHQKFSNTFLVCISRLDTLLIQNRLHVDLAPKSQQHLRGESLRNHDTPCTMYEMRVSHTSSY